MKIIPECINKTKRHLCASGSILLPLAQKWGLVGVMAVAALSTFGVQSVSAASLSISVPGSLSLDVKPGEAAKDSTPAGFTVTSDAYWGYTLSVKSNNAEGALTNGSNKISSIGKGITTLNQFSNNTWGFRVSGEGVANPANYRQGPTTTLTDVAKTTGQKGANEIHDYSFVLAAKVDNTIPTGTYTGTFTFMVTANVVNYTVNYDDNDGDGGPGMITAESQEQSVQLSNITPTKEHYGFAGWCTQKPTDGNCTGKTYWPGDTYELSSGSNTLNLYATWVSASTMQNWKGCGDLQQGDIVYLEDTRDNNVYRIAKLKDNRCWMAQNLRLGGAAPLNLTAENTDLNGQQNSFTLPASSLDNFINEDDRLAFYIDTGEYWQNGGWYNWHVATAGSGSTSMTSGEAPSSICPKGWRLPTGGTTSSSEQKIFRDLYPSTADTVVQPIPGFVSAGHGVLRADKRVTRPQYEDELIDLFWSSTASNSTKCDSAGTHCAYSLVSHKLHAREDSTVYVTSSRNMNQGQSVRCVSRN